MMPSSFSTRTAALVAAALSYSSFTIAAPPPQQQQQQQQQQSIYTLATEFSGPSFFDNFTTYTGQDPTNGHVRYTTTQVAAQNEFAGFTPSGNAYIGVDDRGAAPDGRQALRLTSKQTISVGTLSVFDIHHVPSGCGLWPAVWYLGSGKEWPQAGEADIFENVNGGYYSAQTLHTSSGCSVTDDTSAFQGNLSDTNCNAGNGALGCSVAATSNYTSGTTTFATAGSGFNAQGGGVYVHEWTAEGMTVWFFPRSAIPADISAGTPSPQSWHQHKPLARFAGAGCDWTNAFQEMQLIINTDFCGDWAGKEWEASGCAAKTNTETCDAFVANNPNAFADAYWEIASIKIYTGDSVKLGSGPDPNAVSNRGIEAPTMPDVPETTAEDTRTVSEAEARRAMEALHYEKRGEVQAAPLEYAKVFSSEASISEVAAWWTAAVVGLAVAAALS